MTTAREREVYKQDMIKTGGGSLTSKQKKIVNNLLYEDLVNKLGVSATGIDARFDDDSSTSSAAKPQPPTARLRTRISSTISGEEIADAHTEHSDSDTFSNSTASTVTKLTSAFQSNFRMKYTKTKHAI